jgi:hypothetical protein
MQQRAAEFVQHLNDDLGWTVSEHMINKFVEFARAEVTAYKNRMMAIDQSLGTKRN